MAPCPVRSGHHLRSLRFGTAGARRAAVGGQGEQQLEDGGDATAACIPVRAHRPDEQEETTPQNGPPEHKRISSDRPTYTTPPDLTDHRARLGRDVRTADARRSLLPINGIGTVEQLDRLLPLPGAAPREDPDSCPTVPTTRPSSMC